MLYRAYAIQHRRRVVLAPSIDLPHIFESQDPKLAYGFVTLAKVFAAVDGPLITAWKDQPPPGTADTSQKVNQSIARYLCRNDVEGVPSSEMEETQRLDILVTQYWLRVLVCQLQMGRTPQPTATCQRSTTPYVLNTSRSLLHIISSANPQCLESHGIGMVCLFNALHQVDRLGAGTSPSRQVLYTPWPSLIFRLFRNKRFLMWRAACVTF